MESLDRRTSELGDEILLLRHSGAGGDDELVQALVRHRSKLVRIAARLIRRLGVDEADLDGEGAVDLVFSDLFQSWNRRGRPILRDDEFVGLVRGMARRVISRHHRRSRALKRGGKGVSPRRRATSDGSRAEDAGAVPHGFRRVEADLDRFVSRETPIEDVVIARLELEVLVTRLPDDLHRTILVMHLQGHSIEAIAHDLDLARDTVERKLKCIGRVYRETHPES